jgi:hypothetical protein
MPRLASWAFAMPAAALSLAVAAPAGAQDPQVEPSQGPQVEPSQGPQAAPTQAPPAPAPAAPEPPRSSCCRFSVRFDLFQLIFRRVAVEAEVKIAGPFSIGIEPAWIWGGPVANLDEQGFQLLGFAAWTFYGPVLRGFWVRVVAGFEAFDATLTHPDFADSQVKKGISSGIFGLMVGDSVVFGQNGGIALSGGIGAGVATSDAVEIITPSLDPDVAPARAQYYQDASRVKLLGSLGVGLTF